MTAYETIIVERPEPRIARFVMALAQRIAARPSFALKLAKESVNRSVDPAGLHPSVRKPQAAK